MSTLTVGTIAEKVTDAGVSVDGVTLKDGGATLSGDLTIGDASASDRKIVFDGNAQDFHIGLDDSADSLTIGLGSALGTTSHMVIDANGHITKPLQPAFHVRKGSSANTNMSGSGNVITFGTEVFDQNGDFASNVFTAPVTGRYFLGFNVRLESPNSSCTFHYFAIATSNFEYNQLYDQPVTASSDYHGFSMSVLADMDANDTAQLEYTQSGGSATSDVTGFDAHAQFFGYLVA